MLLRLFSIELHVHPVSHMPEESSAVDMQICMYICMYV